MGPAGVLDLGNSRVCSNDPAAGNLALKVDGTAKLVGSQTTEERA